MAVSGTGTATDPYIPTTFADFKTCVAQAGVYVCLMQDIDVSKDSVYKTGITQRLDIVCRYVYGTAMTYSDTTAYEVNDKCTYNDGEHGLCTYTCIQACTGIDVTNTEYWTRGGNPTKKITGLVITANHFFEFNQSNNNINISNLFFESCAWDKTSNDPIFWSYKTGRKDIAINDCAFSMFYNQHNYSPMICLNQEFTFFRSSLYMKYPGNYITYSSAYGNVLIRGSSVNNCTIDIEDVGLTCDSVGGQNTTFGTSSEPMVNSSIRVKAYITTSGNSKYISFATSGSFSAFTALGVSGDSVCIFTPIYLKGTNIIDKDVVGQATIGTSENLIQGTTAQCKDKDWLTSQGFFTS